MHTISHEIIERAAARDIESFEQIYRAYERYVYNIVYRIVQQREDAQEVTMDIFFTVYNKLDQFKFQSSLKTWIYRIALNQAINYSKKTSKIRRQTKPLSEHVAHVPTIGSVPKNIEKEHHQSLIDRLLAGLNPDQRICIILRSMEGLSYQEIADTLGININTVRTRLKRAREALLHLSKGVVPYEM